MQGPTCRYALAPAVPPQVAQKQQGQAVTFRAVFMEVLREDGWSGFFRAAGPRMANSALWGTAMMSVYEALKRFSLKEEP